MSYVEEVQAMRRLAAALSDDAGYLHSPHQRRISTEVYARMVRASLYIEAAASMLQGQGQLAALAQQQAKMNEYQASQ